MPVEAPGFYLDFDKVNRASREARVMVSSLRLRKFFPSEFRRLLVTFLVNYLF
jgi:hypothetical protein